MELTEARALAREKTEKDTTYRHLVSVEGVMRALAGRFPARTPRPGRSPGCSTTWTRTRPGAGGHLQHARMAAGWLREAGVDEVIVNGVLAHAYEEYRTDLMSKAVVHADAVAGLLVASALVRPEKATGMKVSSVKKKLKERSFAPGVNREEVTSVEESIGLPLDEFIATGIEGLQQVAPDIGL